MNLLLVVVDDSPARRSYAAALKARLQELTAHDTACIVTGDAVEGECPECEGEAR